jgi:transcription antitermination protein NusB
MGSRRKGREFALQAIYLADITKMPEQRAFRSLVRGNALDEKGKEFAEALAAGTLGKKVELDALIKKYAKNWDLDRMAALDRNILRLGAYEILYELDTPVSVIIDEAVEIAKAYSTSDSGKFVNGILDRIKDERKAGADAKKSKD